MDIRSRIDGVAIGRLAAVDGAGRARVQIRGGGKPATWAPSLVFLEANHIGRDVIVAFEEGDLSRPVVLGLVQGPESPRIRADVDGETVRIDGRKEVVLRCGRASITLTRAGKIILRGAYLLSRSSGVNRIKGGSVQIN